MTRCVRALVVLTMLGTSGWASYEARLVAARGPGGLTELSAIRGYGCIDERFNNCDATKVTDLCRNTKCVQRYNYYYYALTWVCPMQSQLRLNVDGWYEGFGIPDNDKGKEKYGDPIDTYCFLQTGCAGWQNIFNTGCLLSNLDGNYYCQTAGPDIPTDKHTAKRAAGRNCPIPPDS